MTEAVEQIKAQVGRLSMEERAELAHFFIRSLDEDGEDEREAEAAWKAELARRAEEIQSGKVVGIPLEQVLDELGEE